MNCPPDNSGRIVAIVLGCLLILATIGLVITVIMRYEGSARESKLLARIAALEAEKIQDAQQGEEKEKGV